jgi:menaquinone-dependent protoporphyrinogen IX oxidase
MNASKPVLVVYYSRTGNTARVARDLAGRLDAHIEIIQDQSHGSGILGKFVAAFDAWRRAPARIGALRRDPAEYALTIVGTPVWAGQMTPAVRSYLEQTSSRLQSLAVFVTSGDTHVEKIQPSLEAAASRKAIVSAGFNARELGDTAAYQRKLLTFVEDVTRTVLLTRRVA